ncbi:MAG: hypothetical protein HeimC3_36550 [Candidatus Heimdallarchaeota archaeon LC_3]|nr:MAG: hypothetical protein HeimC3_36550 [Candidatus Heimdallarchaeota archaeon LC_3]
MTTLKNHKKILKETEQEFLDSGGHLKLTLQEFEFKFNLPFKDAKFFFDELKSKSYFYDVKDYENGIPDPIHRLTMNNFYAFIKNSLISEEQDSLFSLSENLGIQLTSSAVQVEEGQVVGLELVATGLGKREFPIDILKFSRLRYLCLKANGLKNVPEIISKLSNITKLDLSNNQIQKLPEFFRHFINLKELDISRNDIQNPEQLIKDFNFIETIHFPELEIYRRLQERKEKEKAIRKPVEDQIEQIIQKLIKNDEFSRKLRKSHIYVKEYENFLRDTSRFILRKNQIGDKNIYVLACAIVAMADVKMAENLGKKTGIATLTLIAKLGDLQEQSVRNYFDSIKYIYLRLFDSHNFKKRKLKMVE